MRTPTSKLPSRMPVTVRPAAAGCARAAARPDHDLDAGNANRLGGVEPAVAVLVVEDGRGHRSRSGPGGGVGVWGPEGFPPPPPQAAASSAVKQRRASR